jgi:uncharacterized protein
MKVGREDGRFFMRTEHGTAELLYEKIGDKKISIYHTFTPEEDRNKGIAGRLAVAAFEFAKENGLKVRPDCPYVQHFLEKHKEWSKYVV